MAELPVKKGVHSDSVDGLAAAVEANKEITFPLVVKAQVQVGGRGKAGGIKMADNMDELKNVAGQILGMNIKGHIVNRLMAVERADVASEMYLSIMLDRLTKCPLLIFSPAGGVEIEETAKTNPELIFKVPVNPLSGMTKDITSDMASKAGLTGKTAAQFEETLCKLYDFFLKRDCLLAEINPLAVDHDGNIVVLDGKVSVDDSALYRQPEVQEFKASLEKEENPKIIEAIRGFVYNGGGIIGVGEPSGHQYQGHFFQLANVFGVEEETGFTLGYDKYNWDEHEHFILEDSEEVDFGEGKKNIYALPSATILVQKEKEVQMAVNEFGKGRAVYISGLPYSFENSRVLYRAVLWSTHSEDELNRWFSTNYNVDVHAYPKNNKYCVVNNTDEPQQTTIYRGDGSSFELALEPNQIIWYEIA